MSRPRTRPLTPEAQQRLDLLEDAMRLRRMDYAALVEAVGCGRVAVWRWVDRGDGRPGWGRPVDVHATTATLAAGLRVPESALTPGSGVRLALVDRDGVVLAT